MSIALVEFEASGKAIRIFREAWQAREVPAFDLGLVREHNLAEATKQIRDWVFARDEFACVACAESITTESGELHERQWRGRIEERDGKYYGGEVSRANSETRCFACHKETHGREVKWSPKTLTSDETDAIL